MQRVLVVSVVYRLHGRWFGNTIFAITCHAFLVCFYSVVVLLKFYASGYHLNSSGKWHWCRTFSFDTHTYVKCGCGCVTECGYAGVCAHICWSFSVYTATYLLQPLAALSPPTKVISTQDNLNYPFTLCYPLSFDNLSITCLFTTLFHSSSTSVFPLQTYTRRGLWKSIYCLANIATQLELLLQSSWLLRQLSSLNKGA